jgi:hypothetical protein
MNLLPLLKIMYFVAEKFALPNKRHPQHFFFEYISLINPLIIFFASKSTEVFFKHSASYFSFIF